MLRVLTGVLAAAVLSLGLAACDDEEVAEVDTPEGEAEVVTPEGEADVVVTPEGEAEAD